MEIVVRPLRESDLPEARAPKRGRTPALSNSGLQGADRLSNSCWTPAKRSPSPAACPCFKLASIPREARPIGLCWRAGSGRGASKESPCTGPMSRDTAGPTHTSWTTRAEERSVYTMKSW